MVTGAQQSGERTFANPGTYLSNLAPEFAGSLVSAGADLVLVIDADGVIRDMAFGNEELRQDGCESWIGKSWAQTVTVESRPKIEAMLHETRPERPFKWRHVNHPVSGGVDLPISYAVVPAPRSAVARGAGGDYRFAFGRELRAHMAMQQKLVSVQLSMERDYWRLRHLETRYRLLFQVSSEAVLILDALTEKVEEANPAAYSMFGDVLRRNNWSLADGFDASSVPTVRDLLARLRANGRADPIAVRLIGGASDLALSASLFRQESATHLLVRVAAQRALDNPGAESGRHMLQRVMENAPDAFVITDNAGLIITTNRAFLELAQLVTEDLARGQSLERWLGRSGVDLNVLISNLRQSGSVRLFATRMRGEFGSTAEVEISAVAVVAGDDPCLGFTIRDVGRRLAGEGRTTKELPRSASQMTELVGRVPLKDIVRETTDLIEQLCIQAALELTGDNRASAAEMLGLSRQSLYVKLRRFGINDVVPGEDVPVGS